VTSAVFLWLGLAGSGYNKAKQGGGIIAICAGRKRCVPPTRRCTGRLGSRPSACELASVGRLPGMSISESA
jgi:hypothetical protein